MTITDVKIRKTFDSPPLRAIVSVTFDDCLALHDIKIVSTGAKDILVMPARKSADGKFKDIVHPTTLEFRLQLEKTVMDEYFKYLAQQAPENS